MLERRRLPGDRGRELALAAPVIGELLLAEPQRVGELESPDRLLDPVAQTLGQVGGEGGARVGADQLLEGAPLRVGELHHCMLEIGTDMAETPDEILRALADPERLTIAGALAQRSRTASALAKDLGLELARVRKHL